MLIIWHKVQLQRQIMIYFKDLFRNPNFSPLAGTIAQVKEKWLQGAIWRVHDEEVPNMQSP